MDIERRGMSSLVSSPADERSDVRALLLSYGLS